LLTLQANSSDWSQPWSYAPWLSPTTNQQFVAHLPIQRFSHTGEQKSPQSFSIWGS
jgi:hypothetical protein